MNHHRFAKLRQASTPIDSGGKCLDSRVARRDDSARPGRYTDAALKQLRLHVLVMTLVAGLLVPVTAFARVLSICNMGGRTGKACCCQHSQPESEQCKTPAIDRALCCTEVTSHAEKASAVQAGPAADVPPAVLLGHLPMIVPIEWALAESKRFAPRARGPPPLGPPIFLRNCAILI